MPMSNADLIRSATDHGVVNSIFENDDEAAVLEELGMAGIADLFVRNSIGTDVTEAAITERIRELGLEPENVLFVDSDPEALYRARESAEGLMTADADIIPYLTNYFAKTRADDPEHKKLEYYRQK